MYILCIFLAVVYTSVVSDPIVQLPNGLIQGREAETIENTTFYVFEGIPYAAPPTGLLRFKAPQPPQNWDGTLNTTHLEVSCFQISVNDGTESEDCLYINVYTPQLPGANSTASVPVMIFIYGGGFDDGSSRKYNAPDLFINNGVILVTFNYRVGAFGFLSTRDEVIPGNNGLKDQQFAIQWTHNNIHLFGGDSNKITLFGQSSGSASVAYHLLNPKSMGLFQRAILQSGSCLSPWAYQRRSREIAFSTAAILNETFQIVGDSHALLDFLQSVEAKDLDDAAFWFRAYENSFDNLEIYQGFYYAPVIEVQNPDAFLTRKMYGLMQAGNFLRVPILIGDTSEESLQFNLVPDIFKITLKAYDNYPEWLVPNDMQISNLSERANMGRQIRQIYTEGEPFADHPGNGIRYSSDTSFTRSVIKHAELTSKNTETYFYIFSYHGPMGYFNVHYDGAETVAHGEDTYYLFCSGLDCDDSRFPEADRLTRRRLIKLWTDFAKYGNPTPEPSELLQNIQWPLFTSKNNFNYLDIGENLEIRERPKEDTYDKWNQLYDSLTYSDFDTFLSLDWDGVFDATNTGVTCFQTASNSDSESEDCLFINVYTPQLPSEDNPVSLPVMFFIHGGGFVDGTGMYVAPDLFLNQDVILAAINYRVGVFGFISTQDAVIPGNNGLKDQQFAIQWAHDNIHLFGGNPDKITIFGQSAGSASCAYQLLNHKSDGLFQGAILESGSFLSPWAYQRNARKIAFKTASFLDSSFDTSDDSQALLDFLLTVEARDLDGAAEQFHNFEAGPQDEEIIQGFYYAPIVEVQNPDAFLTRKMYGLLNAGNVIQVPILIGITSEENILFDQDPNGFRDKMVLYDENLDWVVPNDMEIANVSDRIEMGRLIRELYTDGEPFADHLGDGIRYSSDTSFTRSVIRHGELFSKVAETYFYIFSYDGAMGNVNVHYDGAESVGHGEETAYLFCSGTGCDDSGYPESDRTTRKRLVELWTNFAKYKNPTPEVSELLQNVTWPLVSTDNGDYFYLDINENLEIKNHPKEDTYEDWKLLYDDLTFQDFDTY